MNSRQEDSPSCGSDEEDSDDEDFDLVQHEAVVRQLFDRPIPYANVSRSAFSRHGNHSWDDNPVYNPTAFCNPMDPVTYNPGESDDDDELLRGLLPSRCNSQEEVEGGVEEQKVEDHSSLSVNAQDLTDSIMGEVILPSSPSNSASTRSDHVTRSFASCIAVVKTVPNDDYDTEGDDDENYGDEEEKEEVGDDDEKAGYGDEDEDEEELPEIQGGNDELPFVPSERSECANVMSPCQSITTSSPGQMPLSGNAFLSLTRKKMRLNDGTERPHLLSSSPEATKESSENLARSNLGSQSSSISSEPSHGSGVKRDSRLASASRTKTKKKQKEVSKKNYFQRLEHVATVPSNADGDNNHKETPVFFSRSRLVSCTHVVGILFLMGVAFALMTNKFDLSGAQEQPDNPSIAFPKEQDIWSAQSSVGSNRMPDVVYEEIILKPQHDSAKLNHEQQCLDLDNVVGSSHCTYSLSTISASSSTSSPASSVSSQTIFAGGKSYRATDKSAYEFDRSDAVAKDNTPPYFALTKTVSVGGQGFAIFMVVYRYWFWIPSLLLLVYFVLWPIVSCCLTRSKKQAIHKRTATIRLPTDGNQDLSLSKTKNLGKPPNSAMELNGLSTNRMQSVQSTPDSVRRDRAATDPVQPGMFTPPSAKPPRSRKPGSSTSKQKMKGPHPVKSNIAVPSSQSSTQLTDGLATPTVNPVPGLTQEVVVLNKDEFFSRSWNLNRVSDLKPFLVSFRAVSTKSARKCRSPATPDAGNKKILNESFLENLTTTELAYVMKICGYLEPVPDTKLVQTIVHEILKRYESELTVEDLHCILRGFGCYREGRKADLLTELVERYHNVLASFKKDELVSLLKCRRMNMPTKLKKEQLVVCALWLGFK